MKDCHAALNRATVALLAAVVTVATCLVVFVLPAHAALKPTLVESGGNRPVTGSGYLNAQGLAFDTYTKADGYSFAMGTDGNSNVKVYHFKLTGADTYSTVKEVAYATKNVGHPNDACVFQKGKYKYMFVSVTGGSTSEKFYSKTSAGATTKIAVIRLDDFNKGSSKVYGCKVKVKKGVKMTQSVKKSAFSGITFVGKKKVGKKKRPVVVMKDGRTFYAAYITVSKKRAVTFTIYDSARVNKPTLKYGGKSYNPATQGVTFHNGYLYLSYSGEGTGNKATEDTFLLTRITYKKLFKGTYKSIKKLEVFSKRIEKTTATSAAGAEVLTKCIPESIFFKTLNGTGNMYVSFNRARNTSAASDIDCVLRSTQKY